MSDVLARIAALEQRLRGISRSRLLFAASLLAIFVLTPLLLIDADVWLHLLGAAAALVAGLTGLVKAVDLWWKASDNGKQVLESEAVQQLEYELSVTKRLLRVCEDGISLYQESRFNPERFGR